MGELSDILANLQAARTGQAPGLPAAPRVALSRPIRRAPLNLTVKKPGQDRSLWGQVKANLGGAVDYAKAGLAGLPHLGATAARTAYGFTVKPLSDLSSNAYADLFDNQSVDWNPLSSRAEAEQSLDRYNRENIPLAQMQADSLVRTASHLRHPSTFAKAYREGTLVPTLFEDVANLSLGAGLAAKGASAAGLTRTAVGLERASALGGATANLPISVPAKGLTKVGRTLAPSVERLAAQTPALARFGSKGRAVMGDTRAYLTDAEDVRGRVIREGHSVVERNPSLGDSPLTAAEQGAAVAVRTGEAAQLADALDRGLPMRVLLDEGFSPAGQRAAGNFLDEQAANLAVQHQRGILDETTTARVQPALDFLEQRYGQMTEEALAGFGRQRPVRRTEGSDVAPAATDGEAFAQRVEEARALEPDRDWSQSKPEDFLTPDEIADPHTWNPEWRPMMQTVTRLKARLDDALANPDGGLVAEHGVDQVAQWRQQADTLPSNPIEMRAAGMDPQFVRQQEAGFRASDTPRELAGRHPVGVVRLGSELQREGTSATPHTIAGHTALIGDELSRTRLNEGYRMVTGEHGASIIKAIGKDRWDALNREVDAHVADLGAGPDARQNVLRNAILEAADAAGLEPWPTGMIRGKFESFELGDRVRMDIDADTPLMPKGLRVAVDKSFRPDGPPPAVVKWLIDKPNSMFKRLVLPLSVTWHLGDAVFNTIVAASEGTSPLQLWEGMRQVRTLRKTDAGMALVDDLSSDIGNVSFDARNWLRDVADDAAKEAKLAAASPGRQRLARIAEANPIRKANQAGFNFNGWFNDYQRNAHKIVQLQQKLAEQGLTLDDVVDPKVRLSKPVQDAISEVVVSANKVLGIGPLTRVERVYLRRAMPFYNWMRLINSFTARQAVQHPARIVWTVNLGNWAATDEELPPFLAGAFKIGGKYLTLGSVNPFQDYAAGVIPSPRSIAGSLAPSIKVGLAGAFGVDANRGMQPLTGQAGTGGRDWYGRDTGRPLYKDPSTLLGYALRQLPQTRAATELAPSMSVGGLDLGPGARYGSGEVITDKYGRRLDPNRNLMPLIPQLAGARLPWPTISESDVEQMRAIRARRLADSRRP